MFFDGQGYEVLKQELQRQDVRHILLCGYNTDMCVCNTAAGYEFLRKDFNVFLVGDATVATFPAQPTPAAATTAAVCLASLQVMITESADVQILDQDESVDGHRGWEGH